MIDFSSSDIVVMLSLVTTCATVIIPPIVTAHVAKADRQHVFKKLHKAEAVEAFLEIAGVCVFMPYEPNPGKMLAAFGDASFYVDKQTRELMFQYCDLLNASPDAKSPADAQSKRKELFDQIVVSLQKNPPRA